MKAGVAVVERDVPVESLIDVDLGTGEAEALSLLWDLEALAVPLHDVVVADHALMNEAADAIQVFGGGTPCGLHFTRPAGEAAVVVGEKEAEHGVGGVQIAGLRQTELAGEAVLEHTPEAFDAALGLWTAGGDEGDAELFERAAELGGLTFSGELFFDGPKVVVAHEDAAVIAVEGKGSAMATQQLTEQREIAEGGFGREELSGQDFSGGVVLQAEGGKSGTAAFQPVVRGTVELHQLAFTSGSQTALAMSGSAALAGRTDARLAQETAEGLATESEALDLAKFFAEVVIVEAGIGSAGQANDGLPDATRKTARTGPTAVGVRQSRLPLLPQTFLETPHLTDAKREQYGGSGACHLAFSATGNYAHSLQFLLTQRECPSSHGVTFSRCC